MTEGLAEAAARLPLGGVTVTLEAPLRLTGPRETHVLTVGPLEGGPAGALGLLGAVLTVDELAPSSRVVLRWRIAEPRTDAEREPRPQVARLEGHGAVRIVAALDRDEIPPGASRVYTLTAQLEGGVLVGRISAGMARAGVAAPAETPDPGRSPKSDASVVDPQRTEEP